MFRLVPLYDRAGNVRAEAKVDVRDAEPILANGWHLCNAYAARWICQPKRRLVYMHRQILGLEAGDLRQCDHINRDRLDNRRSNLRICSPAENQQNKPSYRGTSSKYRGVTWHKALSKWQAQCKVGDRLHYLGLFEEEEDAHTAVVAWRMAHWTHSVEELV